MGETKIHIQERKKEILTQRHIVIYIYIYLSPLLNILVLLKDERLHTFSLKNTQLKGRGEKKMNGAFN